ncbi:protein NDRG3-like isoform X2 [Artemia franciscana]|uniref:protein NDRG3-like isoform X2 n=1 Tax=Artemia franciscana TaxID=6661 RepID=UPI0032DA1DAE
MDNLAYLEEDADRKMSSNSLPNGCPEIISLEVMKPRGKSLEKKKYKYDEVYVGTQWAEVLVAIQGDRRKPALMTYHDLGLNHITNFQAFFNYAGMEDILSVFCVYHVNAPGQEEGCQTLPEGFAYPTMDELAEQLVEVLTHFQIPSIVGLGVGVGGNVLARLAINYPSKDYYERAFDLAHAYSEYFQQKLNPINFAYFIESYIQRSDLGISRDENDHHSKKLNVPVLNMTGWHSPHKEETVTLNARLNPATSSWMKIQDCCMILEEQPGKIAEAIRLFLQGQGYAMKLAKWKHVKSS